MPPNGKTTRVVAIIDPGMIEQQIATAIGSQQEFELVGTIGTTEKLIRELHALQPDIILIDHTLSGQPTLDIIDDIALQVSEAALIAILPGEDSQKAQQVMLAGARAFLIHPFTQLSLLNTLRRMRDLEVRRVQTQAIRQAATTESQRPMRTVAVYSPRGGVGCTTAAINLALALQEETAQHVLLMEGKLFFGHVSVMLNLRAQNTLADLIPHSSHLDEGLVHDVMAQHVSGIDVLLGPRDIQVAQGIRSDDLYNVFVALQRMYDFIIVDVGSYLTENAVTLMDSADRILLVTTPDMASLHDTSRFYQISQTLSYSPDKLMIVLNRSGMMGGIKDKEIETALHYPLFARIPDDEANAVRSLNRGVPLVFKYPHSPASKAYKQIAKSLAEMRSAETVKSVHTPELVKSEALLASSQLG
jgi:pilus assembly protein CpaE